MTFLLVLALVLGAGVGVSAGIGSLLPRVRGLSMPARIGIVLTSIVSVASVVALVMAETLDRGADDCGAAPGKDAAFGIALLALPLILVAFATGLVSRDARARPYVPLGSFVAGIVDVLALLASFRLCFTF